MPLISTKMYIRNRAMSIENIGDSRVPTVLVLFWITRGLALGCSISAVLGDEKCIHVQTLLVPVVQKILLGRLYDW